MKRFKINFAVLALILGTSAAFATTTASHLNSPNVYNDGGTSGKPNWQPLPGGDYQCTGTSNVCTGYQAAPGGPVTQITNGVFSN